MFLSSNFHGIKGETPDFRYIDAIHNNFTAFSKKIDHLFELCKEENLIVEEIGSNKNPFLIFPEMSELKSEKSEVPSWVSDYKPEKLKEMESTLLKLEDDIKPLKDYLKLLYESGDELEKIVMKALNFLGLMAEKTKPGFPTDIIAHTPDEKHYFGIEVTGINDALKRDSKKITQLISFEQIKENDEKLVLIANTFRNLPIDQRLDKEDFSPDSIKFLEKFDVLLMTTWQLFQLVRDVIDETMERNTVILTLIESTGVFGKK